ncbi:hypothetical protein NOF04DRAFT_1349031 [Fusarium oxysporum II5]|nr:hypothetical protein NOF04DRAFT_1349031 [Fusarium oxysporum II5]
MAKGDDGHSRPLPLVQTFDAATAKVNDIVAALMRTGGCDTRTYIQGDGAWARDFFPKETKRVIDRIGKSSAFAKAIIQSLLALTAAKQMLTSTYNCAQDQELHRDDIIYHNPVQQRTAAKYEISEDTGLRYFDQTTHPGKSLTFYAEIDTSDTFLFLSSYFHSGSANKTPNQEQLVYSCFYTKGFLQQEENQ